MFPGANCISVTEDYKDYEPPGFLILWGGPDIHPSLYNRKAIIRNRVGLAPTMYDKEDVKAFINAFNCDIPILGICRGGQMCCIMSGGILIQDVDGHLAHHGVITMDGKRINVNSSHHQMMYPWEVEHQLIAFTAPPKSTHYDGLTELEIKAIPTAPYEGVDDPVTIEPEVVLFPKTNSLAIQFHPEYSAAASALNDFVKSLITTHLLPKDSN